MNCHDLAEFCWEEGPEEARGFDLERLVHNHACDPLDRGPRVVDPDSHRGGLLPAGPPHELMGEEVIWTTRKGTPVMRHGHTWHRVSPLTEARASIHFRCAPPDTPVDITESKNNIVARVL